MSLARWLTNAVSGGIIAYTASKSDSTKGLGAFIAQLVTGPDAVAGVLLALTWLWGHLTHRTDPNGQTPTSNTSAYAWLLIGALAVTLVGCHTPPATTVFNSERLLTDAATGATHTFNVYYHQQLAGNQPPANLDQLNSARDTLYDADRKMAATLAVVDQLRLNYAANPAVTNQSAMFIALQAAQDQSSNIVALVKLFLGTNAPAR